MLGGEDGRAGAASGTASGWLPRLWGSPARAGYAPDRERDTGLTFTVREAAVQLLPLDVARTGCRFSFGACKGLGREVEGGTWTMGNTESDHGLQNLCDWTSDLREVE